MIRIKRVYDSPEEADGLRILVDRLWPRGLKREEARVDRWLKDLAPSEALRRWFGHDPRRWQAFQQRYHRELETKAGNVEELLRLARSGTVTLLYAARDRRCNNAEALKAYLEAKMRRERGGNAAPTHRSS